MTYRVDVAVSMLLLVTVEVMKLVEATTTVDMVVEKTVVVTTCPACCVEVTVTVTVVSGSVVGCE